MHPRLVHNLSMCPSPSAPRRKRPPMDADPAVISHDPPEYRAVDAPTPPRTAPTIRGPEDVASCCRGLTRRRFEEFHVLLLNARHEIIRRVLVSRGSLNASIVHPREVFRPAIIASAASVVLVHNHPSGDPQPSDEDLALTRRLVQVGDLHGIPVLDHVIVARGGIVSLRARGQM